MNESISYFGSVYFPLSGTHYENNKKCSWRVQQPKGNNAGFNELYGTYEIMIWKLDIEEESTCRFDWLKVKVSPTDNIEGILLCGTFQRYGTAGPLCLSLNSSSFEIEFSSDYAQTRRGFGLDYFPVGFGNLTTRNDSCKSFLSLEAFQQSLLTTTLITTSDLASTQCMFRIF